MNELHMKYEQVLVAYNMEIRRRLRDENELTQNKRQQVRLLEVGESSQGMIASSPTPPPPTSPIFEILDTPLHQEEFSREDVEEERAKLKALEIETWKSYEEKIRDTMLHFVSNIDTK